ncbi:agmatinase family protein [Flaviaesturariibacter flavus]|uniref:Agmatinase family protein n=1 Tax=Flaviaesturariibacter flavus TaxID=2502780 RepID=A0A4R1BNK7_9BACT|nr:agmatinase family protein [Flaviaesturariibacter flavus]TCJ19129.1 agmatinase family protein [Flaviaesturariibacter flavus]
MTDLSTFDPNSAGNPNNNVFGLPFTEEDARLVILPVPWEVTVSFGSGTARSAEQIMKASLQVDLFDPDVPEGWKQGFFMRETDRKILMKSDYLRKEAELYIDYISNGEIVDRNQFMCKSLREINEGSYFLNNWVHQQTKGLLEKGKLVALLGGDHSTPLGFFKALGETHGEYGILQIDAHCDLRIAYEDFVYSHASIMYNMLQEVPQVTKLVQVGIRDYSGDELEFIRQRPERIRTFFDRDIRHRQFEGETWKSICEDIVAQLPQKVHISFDIDGLDPKLCPNTGTPVQGGFETEQVYYLFNKIREAGKQIISFDLNEVSTSENAWDANVGARVLFKLCNLLVASNPQ